MRCSNFEIREAQSRLNMPLGSAVCVCGRLRRHWVSSLAQAAAVEATRQGRGWGSHLERFRAVQRLHECRLRCGLRRICCPHAVVHLILRRLSPVHTPQAVLRARGCVGSEFGCVQLVLSPAAHRHCFCHELAASPRVRPRLAQVKQNATTLPTPEPPAATTTRRAIRKAAG
jgi:hypothetical protein